MPLSIADRELVFQDFSLVLVPGRRLNRFPRARARRFASTKEKSALRALEVLDAFFFLMVAECG